MSKGFELEAAEATQSKALSARANYLSQDRPDISHSGKQLCRAFAVLNENSFLKLKRLGRYVCGLPRLVYEYPLLDTPLTRLTRLSIPTFPDVCQLAGRQVAAQFCWAAAAYAT